ncbi:hypothetical protein FOZ63_026408 [Perkinsus olseni]|uniref:RING-type domain-containing protein n=1 Tax=Perkinsus olseni TaxID=32597 RepID=A0A7J6UI04_PEROL|nr:hypothetical protein FOZ63_026408 [Perkinsus olseni]
MMDQKGPDKLIGSGSCSLADLQAASIKEAPVVVQLLRPDDQAIEAGALTLENIEMVKHVSFLEYIEGGLEINLIVAIDFTFSNGDPNHPSSLHYYHPHSANDYVMAIRAVGEILEHYDQDKKYPVYGFGAKLPPDYSHTSHLFACNGDYFLPEVVGVDGIVDAYRKALQVVHLHGPTMFSEIIQLASGWAEQNSVGKTDEQKYFILLILTDGAIVDLQATIDAIVEASKAPLSIIIVGVGDQDFGMMNVLDADDHPLVSSIDHSTMERDIVQFVPFNEFKDKSYTELAMATLDEVPREVVNYYHNKNKVLPRPRRDVADANDDPPIGDPSVFEAPKCIEQDKRRTVRVLTKCGLSATGAAGLVEDSLPCIDDEYLAALAKQRPREDNPAAGGPFYQCLQTLKQHNLSFAHGMNVSVLSSELSSPLPQQGPPSPSSKSGFRRASAGSRMSFVRSSTREALSVRDVAGGSWGENDGMSPVSEEASVAVPNASAPMSPESEAPGEGPPEGVARPELQSQSSSGGRSSRRRSTGRRRTSTQRRSRSHISRSSTGTIAVLDEESGLCKVCFENATNTVLLPCKHQCMCLDCAAGVKDSTGKCPICRLTIDTVIDAIQS